MTAMTGRDKIVVAFDCDGTLTNAGVTVIGQDNGQKWDVHPIWVMQQLGCIVAVMTCNEPEYVTSMLRQHGIDAYADPDISDPQYRNPPDDGRVMVTGRKVVADLYVDDNGLRWKFGDPLVHIVHLLHAREVANVS